MTVQPQRTEATDLYTVVLQRLAPQDHVKLAAFVYASADAAGSRSILAVVSNVDADREEAIILLFSYPNPIILAALPILSNLEISVSQVAGISASITNTQTSIKCKFSVGGEQSLEASSEASQDITDIVTEVRRLVAVATGSPTVNRNRTAPPPEVSPVLPDLPEWRKNWLIKQMRENEAEYVEPHPLSVRIASWNVYGKVPSSNLQGWLIPDEQSHADLYVIGLQEVDDDPQALLRYTPFREKLWCEIVQKTLETSGQRVVKVASQQLVGLMIIAFANVKIATNITDVQATYVGTGTLNMGNKGATAIRFRYHSTYLTFVTSHLAAFHDQVDARNRDFAEICRRLVLPQRSHESSPRLRPPLAAGPTGKGYPIFDTGDLNYRVEMANAEARSLAASSDWSSLLAKDQLREQMQKGRVFHDFQEADINFAPSYKFDVGTNDYDTSEKQRIPAFTDRILWLPARSTDIQCLSYKSYPTFLMSDHKPVAASFKVTVSALIPGKREVLEAKLLRELDALENEAMPDLELEPQVLDMKVDEEVPGRTLQLSNSRGKVAVWRFVPKPEQSKICEDWLRISQREGTVPPGDSTQIHFVLDTTAVVAAAAEAGDTSVGEVLILSVQGGRDIFIPVNVEIPVHTPATP